MNPEPAGSPTEPMTIGIVRVRSRRALVGGDVAAMMTSKFKSINSEASAG